MRMMHLIARSIVVAVVLLGIACVLRAEAQCTFERSPKAKKLDFSLVRALEECPGITHPAPNVMLGTLPACTPPIAESEYSFGSKGTCDVRLLQRAGKSCAAPPCSELTLKAKCRDILDGTSSPTNGEPGWKLKMGTSVTQTDADQGDHAFTFTQVPVEFEFPPSDNGKLALTLTSSALDIREALGWPPLPLSRCASVQFSSRLDVSILDPMGDRFALPGTTVASAAPSCGIDRVSRAKGLKGTSLVRVFEDECDPTPPPP